MFLNTSIDAEGSNYSSTIQEKCAILWSSPTLSLVGYMYDFMFRAAYAVPINKASDNAPSYIEKFSVSSQGIELWYDTNQGFFAASIAVMLLGLLAAISLLWGCWQLDRCVTLSPLETAKAFGAPVFAAAGPKQEVDEIMKKVGQEKVTHNGDELLWSGNGYASGTHLGSLKGSAEDGSIMLRSLKGSPSAPVI